MSFGSFFSRVIENRVKAHARCMSYNYESPTVCIEKENDVGDIIGPSNK